MPSPESTESEREGWPGCGGCCLVKHVNDSQKPSELELSSEGSMAMLMGTEGHTARLETGGGGEGEGRGGER